MRRGLQATLGDRGPLDAASQPGSAELHFNLGHLEGRNKQAEFFVFFCFFFFCFFSRLVVKVCLFYAGFKFGDLD